MVQGLQGTGAYSSAAMNAASWSQIPLIFSSSTPGGKERRKLTWGDFRPVLGEGGDLPRIWGLSCQPAFGKTDVILAQEEIGGTFLPPVYQRSDSKLTQRADLGMHLTHIFPSPACTCDYLGALPHGYWATVPTTGISCCLTNSRFPRQYSGHDCNGCALQERI